MLIDGSELIICQLVLSWSSGRLLASPKLWLLVLRLEAANHVQLERFDRVDWAGFCESPKPRVSK